jgi:Tfp pilus assembly protein FimV
MADLNEKTAEVENNVRARENELAEMQKLIELKADHGRKLQADA